MKQKPLKITKQKQLKIVNKTKTTKNCKQNKNN